MESARDLCSRFVSCSLLNPKGESIQAFVLGTVGDETLIVHTLKEGGTRYVPKENCTPIPLHEIEGGVVGFRVHHPLHKACVIRDEVYTGNILEACLYDEHNEIAGWYPIHTIMFLCPSCVR